MNAALVLSAAVVMPLAFGGAWWPWALSTLGVVVSMWLSEGTLAAAVLVPWLLAVLFQLTRARSLLDAVTVGFGLVSVSALMVSRLELVLFDIVEPIVKLTAIHFSYAGVGTFVLARRLPASWWQRVTVGLVVAAPVVVASGFVLRSAAGQVGGAVLMTAGTWLVAALNVKVAHSMRVLPRWLMGLSCLAPWVSMVLAVSWAANNYWPSVPALTVVDMVPTHGALNAFGFVLCGLLAWRAQQPGTRF